MALPRRHLTVVALLGVVLACVWIGGRSLDQQANAAPEPPKPPAPLPSLGSAASTLGAAPPIPPAKPSRAPLVAAVRQGDSLSTIFQRLGFTERDLQRLLTSGPLGKRLRAIHPGHEFEFQQDDDGNLVHMTYRSGQLDTVEFVKVGENFKATQVVRQPDLLTGYRHGVIERSLFLACQRIGVDDAFAQRLAVIFQWDIDFILDLRVGDEFHVLFQERHLDGERIGFGDILAAEFVNQGDVYTAVRYEDAAGHARYYAPDGRTMHKTFLRAPVDFTRISSNFNLRRVHPLWKSSMPHRGIDYAAPTGTKVRAAGDGRVETMGRTPANGLYIVLQHGQRYQTKYLHLSRFSRDLRTGKTVRQGQTIGYVGATGWATGPHLHYEFLVDGVHKNPRTVDLPAAAPIAEADKRDFELATKLPLAELKRYKSTAALAATNPSG